MVEEYNNYELPVLYFNGKKSVFNYVIFSISVFIIFH